MSPITINPVVVKLGGAALDDPQAAAAMADAVARASEAGAPLVLVHGGGKAVGRTLDALGLESTFVDGLRLTPETHIDAVTGVLRGVMNAQLVGLLIKRGMRALGLGLSDAGLAHCTLGTRLLGNLAGRVGEIIGGDPAVLRLLLAAGTTPVINSIGLWTDGDAPDGTPPDGGPLNINADDAAAALAGLLGAERLVTLTDVDGVRDEDGSIIDTIDESSLADLAARGVISGGMLPKLRSAVERFGGPTVIGSWRDAAALIAGTEGVGTTVVTESGGRRRRAPATA